MPFDVMTELQLRHFVWAFVIINLSACSGLSRIDRDGVTEPQATAGYLFHAETTIQDQWFHMPVRGETDYRLAMFDGEVAIRAIGRRSASGLIRRVSIDPALCPEIEWSWAVTQLQFDADLSVKELEDVAASIFLLFGDPGFMFDPEPVPTLRYVWTNEHAERDSIVDNPYLKGIVRSIVVEAGNDGKSAWIIERRNFLEDFVRAYGHAPNDFVHAIALFTDNDQTMQDVEAYYGWARVHCVADDISVDEPMDWN